MDNQLKQLFDRLLCPQCRAPLSRGEFCFACLGCRLDFPARDGVVHLVSESQRDEFFCATEAFYDARALRFGHTPRAMGYPIASAFKTRQRAVKRFGDFGEGRQLLDLGCASGLLTAPLAKNNHITGVDISSEMLKQAATLGFDPVQAVGPPFPFAKESFDAVLALGILQGKDRLAGFFQEFYRLLRPGGVLLVSALNGRSFLHRIWRLFDRGRKYTYLHKARTLKSCLSESGFQNVSLMYEFYPTGITTLSDTPRFLWDVLAPSVYLRAEKKHTV